MITLKEWMEIADYRVTEGSDYHVNIPGLYSLSAWNGEQDGWSFFVAFDPRDDQRVYVAEACDYKNNRAYRLRDPAINAGRAGRQAWDDCDFVELESTDDFIQKALAIRSGEDYDTRVTVPVDFTDEELLRFMKMAHEQDITFNQLVERALEMAIDEYRLRDRVDGTIGKVQ